jgi:hypothetical protein
MRLSLKVYRYAGNLESLVKEENTSPSDVSPFYVGTAV